MESEEREAEIEWKGKVLKGKIMPKTKDGFLTLKLESGYNINISEKEARIIIKKERSAERKDDEERNEENGEISILGCGGTIASKVDYDTGAVKPSITASEIASQFPELRGKIRTRQVLQVFSEDMAPSDWSSIAKEIYDEMKRGAKGVVVLHGTDTMHYTSAAVSFMIKEFSAPVVFVGAQRSSDRPSSDNRDNLLNATYLASESDCGECLVCMHESESDGWCSHHLGTRVRKMHTSRRDAFRSIGVPPIYRTNYDEKKIIKLFKSRRKTAKPEKRTFSVCEEVALVQFYPGMKGKEISRLSSYRGVVISATGLGHVSVFGKNNIIKEITELVDSGVLVALAPQTIYGRLNLNVYSTGRVLQDAGVVGHLCDWTPETAYAKMCVVLGMEKDAKKAKEMMAENWAGEITERSVIE